MKQDYTINYNCCQIYSRIAITVVSIVCPACHVFKSYSVDPFSFLRWGRRGTRRGRCLAASEKTATVKKVTLRTVTWRLLSADWQNVQSDQSSKSTSGLV